MHWEHAVLITGPPGKSLVGCILEIWGGRGWREDGAWEKLVPGPFLHADSGRTNSVTLDLDSELGEPFWLHLEDLAPVVGMGP